MKKFKKWNDIQQFHEVTKNLNYPRIHHALKEADYKINYGFKVKLHGTNACVRIEPDGKVVAQKRSSDIPHDTDNAGFREWVANNESYFARLANSELTVYVYGEWCGPGIQKGVASNEIPQNMFFVFTVDYFNHTEDKMVSRVYDSELIESVLGVLCPNDVIVIPWHSKKEINFLEKAKTQQALNEINKQVESIGERCPLMDELFEIQGAGEGLVAYPLLGKTAGCYGGDEEYFSWFNFKAKSEHHRVNKTKDAVQFDPEKFASIQIFADAYCTEARFNQAFTEAVNCEKDMRLVPDFIKWVVQDIYKESKTEREASPNLDWKAVSKACSTRAVLWYKQKVQELV